jgi:hypothetical protein
MRVRAELTFLPFLLAVVVMWPRPVLALKPFLVEAVGGTTISAGSVYSLALDSEGNPHVAFCDSITGNLRYASRSAGAWTIETADGSAIVLGTSSSLALDDEGNPHVSYVDAAVATLETLKYARKVGGVWIVETVNDSGRVFSSSLTLDAGGNPHIGYRYLGPSDPPGYKYARKTGSTWSIEKAPSPLFACYGPSSTCALALDADGNPGMIYPYGPNGGCDWTDWCPSAGPVVYARKSSGNWTVETIGYGFASNRSIALDADGNPHVSYLKEDWTPWGILYLAYYARKFSGAWIYEIVPAGAWDGGSLALDSSGNPRIAFAAYSPEVTYASRTGSAWTVENIDSLSVGPCSLVLDAQGRPHVAYRDFTNGNLKLALGRRIAIQESGEKAISSQVTSSGGAPSVRLFAYPNPSSGGVSIAWRNASPTEEPLDLAVFDVGGRRIRSLTSQPFMATMPSITWDGKEDSGHDAAGGIYFVRMVTSSGGEATTRITLVR